MFPISINLRDVVLLVQGAPDDERPFTSEINGVVSNQNTLNESDSGTYFCFLSCPVSVYCSMLKENKNG